MSLLVDESVFVRCLVTTELSKLGSRVNRFTALAGTRKSSANPIYWKEHVMNFNRTIQQAERIRIHLIVAPRDTNSDFASHLSVAWLHVSGTGDIVLVTSSIRTSRVEICDRL